MQNLISTIRDNMLDWEQPSSDPNRYSLFTQHLMLAEMIREHQHQSSKSSTADSRHDDISFHSLSTEMSDVNRGDSPTIPPIDSILPTPEVTPLPTPLPSALQTRTPSRSSSYRANMGKPRTNVLRLSNSNPAKALANDETFRPTIPKRTSSMNTVPRLGNNSSRLDIACFHRQSRQIFSSLDSTLSNAFSTSSSSTDTSSSSTAPSLASSITTEATSLVDDEWHLGPSYAQLYLELRDPRIVFEDDAGQDLDFGDFTGSEASRKSVSAQRSKSKLSPDITSTAQVFWTSEGSRQSEYTKIDAAHNGVRGMLKRILPKSWTRAHSKRRNFYSPTSPVVSESSPQNDDDSVRRYRISLASITQEAILNAELHGVSSTSMKRRSTQRLIESGNPNACLHQGNSMQPTQDTRYGVSMKHKMLAKVKSAENLSKLLITSHATRRGEKL